MTNVKNENYEAISSDADALSKALEDENLMKETSKLFKSFIDGEPKNINPLTEIPEPQMVLYRYQNEWHTVEEIKTITPEFKDFTSLNKIEYLGEVAGRHDVIRITYKNGRTNLYTAVDEDGYGIYNAERSTYKGEFVWEYNYGDLRNAYYAFRTKGITFENDVYAKIDNFYKTVLESLDETLNKNGFSQNKGLKKLIPHKKTSKKFHN